MILLFQLALRNVLRARKRSFITLLVISSGLWSMISLSAVARGASEQRIKDAIKNLTGHIQIHAQGYLNDPTVDFIMDPPSQKILNILQSPQVMLWAQRVRLPAVVMSERHAVGLTLIGIEPKKEFDLSFLGSALQGNTNLFAEKEDGIIVGKELLETLKTEVGKRIVVMTQHRDGSIADRGMRIIGTFDAELQSTEKAYAFVVLPAAQSLVGIGHALSEIAIVAQDRNNLETLRADLQGAAPDYDIQTWDKLEPLLLAYVKLQDGILLLLFSIVMIVIAFGLVNSLFMSIFERMREIGLLQALGMKPHAIIIQILFESVLLLAVGAGLGNFLAWFTVFYFSHGLDLSHFAKAAEMLNISNRIYPFIKYHDLLVANVLIFVLGLLGSCYPAWKASTYSPLAAIGRK